MKQVSREYYLRITALWAFSEAFLGGILHAFKIPFSGLVLSAFAAICMSAIALKDYKKGRIIKATILVIIVKAMLSPHSPVPAYLAVSLQGIFGELIFLTGLTHRISAFILAMFALMQSAFQKIITLTILFGSDLWSAIDKFLNGINKDLGLEELPYSIYLVGLYLFFYFIAGIIAGIFAGRLPKIIDSAGNEFSSLKIEPVSAIAENQQRRRKKYFSNPVYWILFIVLIISAVIVYREHGFIAAIESKAGKLFMRAALIMLLWYFFIAPLLLQLFHRWLSKQKNKFAAEVEQIIVLLPEIKIIVLQSWKASAAYGGFTRINKFLRILFYLLLKDEYEA